MHTKVELFKRILMAAAAIICLPVLLSGAGCNGEPVISVVTPGPEASVEPAPSSTPSATITPSPTPTPQAPPLQIKRLSLKSKYLDKKMKVNVYLPADYDISKKYPVLYLLHGYRGNENDWENNMDIVNTASELFFSGTVEPFIIVTPDIENSYGVNSSRPKPAPAQTPAAPAEEPDVTVGTEPEATAETPASTPEPTPEATETSTSTPEPTPETTESPAPSNTPEATPADTGFEPSYGSYENYLIKELIPYIDKNYSTIAQKEGRYIGGLSMGGFAALHLCFAHPELFSKAGGHSPALWIYTTDPMKTNDVMTWLYPSSKLHKKRDPLIQADNAKLSGIEIWLDCGNKDSYGFYAGTKKLYDILESRGAQVEYHPFSGGHNIYYWKEHLREYLIFYGS